jgi:L-cysteine:1D-myo-inositol 2-amino-2-deoxy-alpha-D-glucopyranoside ligase
MKSWPEVYIPTIDSKYEIPSLSLFNSQSRKVEELPKKQTYRMYVCGITPYDSTHLGHAATYLTFDLINRYLRATKAEVRFVENITDIDDPLLDRAHRDGVDWKDLAESQIDLFRADMTALHVIPPKFYIGAVEAIDLVTKKIDELDAEGSVYFVENDLYFRVHKDSDFCERSHLPLVDSLKIFAERGGDPDREGKEDPLDSLVWLSKRENEPGWESKHGIGRPGWHIECCAIALNYLEPNAEDDYLIDIQGGGKDLIFPHHEMSAAQAKVSTGRDFARMYIHAGMIGLNGQKMSKSLGNLVFVSKLIEAGVSPMTIRCALIMRPYAEDRMWTEKLLSDAKEFLDSLCLQISQVDCAPTDQVIQKMINSLANNLDTPGVITILKDWIKQSQNGETGGNPGELSRAIDSFLGIAI